MTAMPATCPNVLTIGRAKYIGLWYLYYQDGRWLKFKDAREETT